MRNGIWSRGMGNLQIVRVQSSANRQTAGISRTTIIRKNFFNR